MNHSLPLKHFLALVTLAVALAGCNDSDMGPEGNEFVVREIPPSHRDFTLVETSRERFRYKTRPAAPSQGEPQAGPSLKFTTPEGWTNKGRSMMRDINFTFGENGEGECYVARLPGEGGGLAANVNRWRKQMGASALSEQEVAELPQKTLFGQPATFLSVDGDFTGMGASGPKKNYRMLGVIFSAPSGAVFVKMTGPRELVEKNATHFDEFVSSLDVSPGS